MRLPRPHVSVEIRCRVVLRQLGTMWIDEAINAHRPDHRMNIVSLGTLLKVSLDQLADLLHCTASDLRLDHDPALGAREKIRRNGIIVGYEPAANDPEYLIYREKHAHHIKTNVRGIGAQHPDRVLIKKMRRHERGVKEKPKHKWLTRPMRSANRWPKKEQRS